MRVTISCQYDDHVNQAIENQMSVKMLFVTQARLTKYNWSS